MYRSTKGASKARRDQINAEIRNLKELLPISDADKARLSYLHIMSLACMYTRKSVFFSQGGSLLSLTELSELLSALPGFLLLISSEGKLLYLSDNVAEHLGHSMVDLVAQSDSVYDIIDPNDHFILRNNLVPTTATETDRLFRCHFNTSKFIRRQGAGNKLTLVRARCLSLPASASSYWSSNPVWMCSCSPLEPQTPYPATPKNPLLTPPPDQSFFLACFHSRHARDMKLLDANDSISVYLGYEVEELRSRSWYSLLHPRDLSHASAQHCTLLCESGERRVEMVVRVEACGGSWVWLYMVLQLETGDQPISCLNYVISESEAWSVRQQLCLEQNQLALYLGSGGGGVEPLSSPDQVFTPSSSGLSGQSFDFSMPTSSQSSSDELATQQQQQQSLPQEGFTLLGQWSGPTGSLLSPAGPSPHRPLPPLAMPPLAMPVPQQKGEFVCTPPYTPRFGGAGSFLFGDEQFGLDSSSSSSGGPSASALVGSGVPTSGLLPCSGLALPPPPSEAAARHKSRYGKHNMPGVAGVEYTTMALPEIRGPLYVDVPHGHYPLPPEGLLTPDASPTKLAFPAAFFTQEGARQEEMERLEISLLAQYISAVAEGFYDNPLHPKPSAQSEAVAVCQLFPTGALVPTVDFLPVPEDISLFEESIVVDMSPKNTSSPAPHPLSSSSSSFCCSSSQRSPPVPGTWPSPCHSQRAQSPIGEYHFSSVQSTRTNHPVGGGILGAGLAEEGVALSGMDVVMEMEVEVVEAAMLPTSQSSSIPSSPESVAPPPPAPAPSCAQSLLEELVSMETVFGAGAPMPPAVGPHPELYQLPHLALHHIYPDGTSDHTL
ncbi:neuronal PAS domain-containing protein 4B [Sardina pilchardus]|uniref:neuronal PAS domain-containing protein 4B n=1 Tax=Sardina pilchardus TaxID=27697 RepID=UPI002E111D88